MREIETWARILGYKGLKLKLLLAYTVPKIKKGEIGIILEAHDFSLVWEKPWSKILFVIKFPRNRILVCWNDEVELVGGK